MVADNRTPLKLRAKVLLALAVVGVLALASATVVALVREHERRRPFRIVEELGRFSGLELKGQAPEVERVRARLLELEAISPLGSQETPWTSDENDRRRLWRFPVGDEDGIVLFEGRPPMVIPGGSVACLTVFHADGRRHPTLGRISAGHRMILDDAVLIPAPVHGFACVEIHCRPYAGGASPPRHHYALFPEGMDIVHVANEEGVTVRDRGDRPLGPLSPVMLRRQAEDWEAALESRSAEVLRALYWLGQDRRFGEGPERELAEVVRTRPRVKARLAVLATSSDPWVRESAVLASVSEGR